MNKPLTQDQLNEYKKFRQSPSLGNVCNAPFSNIYFNSWGNAGACWLTLDRAPRYPDQSLKEIWFGQFFEDLRKDIQSLDLKNGCGVCKKRIQDGVYPQVLARAYDIPYPNIKYPQIMEFELSNLCNLACIMCKGSLSSKIRKEREQLDPLKSPYDDQFIEQLKEFIPHLKEARFNGGEPFLQQMCWKVWDAIAEINPEILITVATNGTLLNDKMKAILEKCRFRINVSLDSLDKKTYEEIRVGSNFETVVENLNWYKDYCQRKGTILSVMVNPMRINWQEMSNYVRWCTEKGYFLWFNTIWRPRHLAIWTLPSPEIEKIKTYYDSQDFSDLEKSSDPVIFRSNLTAFQSFAKAQMQGWLKDQIEREKADLDYESQFNKMKGAQSRFASRAIYQSDQSFFEFLETKTAKVFSADILYHYLGTVSEDDLKNQMKNPDRNSVLEWVYQVCDYY
ncbi:MAG: radical SAM protein [Pseudobdellovibrionaceae bacterium]